MSDTGCIYRNGAEPTSNCPYLGILVNDRPLCRSCQEPPKCDGPLAIAIATAPRNYNFLPETLKSLEQAGFRDWKIFTDGGSMTLGPLGNFYRSMATMLMDQPHARGYCFFEDDVLLAPMALERVNEFLATPHWPIKRVASLRWNPEHGLANKARWYQLNTGWLTYGAQGLVFTPAGLRDMVGSQIFPQYRVRGPDGGWANADSIAGMWAARYGGVWYSKDMLLAHVGQWRSDNYQPQAMPGAKSHCYYDWEEAEFRRLYSV